jgi:murein DD-endopeptidase MepM/ murein hydrolase activator NlpD
MAKTPEARRGLRLSRPDSERFFTIMMVFTHRTFRWSIARRRMLWLAGVIAAIWAVAMVGSAYGFWATKKIMSFTQLQQDTFNQQRQLRESLDQAQTLDAEIQSMRQQMADLLKQINPRNPEPLPPPLPAKGKALPAPGGAKPATGGTASGTEGPTSALRPGTSPEKLDQLRSGLERTSLEAKRIRERMDPIVERWKRTPSIPPTAGYLSSGFGLRLRPFSRVNETDESLLGYHSGVDITNGEGTPIQATADGEVEEAGWMGPYGNGVVLSHSDRLQTLYAHMSKVRARVGQKVVRGDILGYMGRTGNATGVHLHYEVRLNGRPVNPMPYMRLQKEWLSSLR